MTTANRLDKTSVPARNSERNGPRAKKRIEYARFIHVFKDAHSLRERLAEFLPSKDVEQAIESLERAEVTLAGRCIDAFDPKTPEDVAVLAPELRQLGMDRLQGREDA